MKVNRSAIIININWHSQPLNCYWVVGRSENENKNEIENWIDLRVTELSAFSEKREHHLLENNINTQQYWTRRRVEFIIWSSLPPIRKPQMPTEIAHTTCFRCLGLGLCGKQLPIIPTGMHCYEERKKIKVFIALLCIWEFTRHRRSLIIEGLMLMLALHTNKQLRMSLFIGSHSYGAFFTSTSLAHLLWSHPS